MGTSVNEGGLNVPLIIRLLTYVKEVGSIIVKKEKSVKKIRKDCGARINISEGNCPERKVTLAGPTNVIFKVFAMIIDKLEEDISSCMTNNTTSTRLPVTLRLVVPARQCGSLIGRGGCKIKEIRKSKGAQVQGTGDMLPNSAERAIAFAGIPKSIIECWPEVLEEVDNVVLYKEAASLWVVAFSSSTEKPPMSRNCALHLITCLCGPSSEQPPGALYSRCESQRPAAHLFLRAATRCSGAVTRCPSNSLHASSSHQLPVALGSHSESKRPALFLLLLWAAPPVFRSSRSESK
ncbi:Poly(rC)-binding protein 2 [Sciurus carolinensis]|uniref:Poly(RC)-binding protein 2 n=1 Tax=Sciurus carolinensis TaxID=30640 RepID=A0AA41TBX1_SCICA|nr:Poly(rC)-binding protein 2 [Sciurus carolinensis]